MLIVTTETRLRAVSYTITQFLLICVGQSNAFAQRESVRAIRTHRIETSCSRFVLHFTFIAAAAVVVVAVIVAAWRASTSIHFCYF